jgi:hypothetical protein
MFIKKLKGFMDEQWLTQSDHDLANYYTCLNSFDKIIDFIQVLHAHVEENMVYFTAFNIKRSNYD